MTKTAKSIREHSEENNKVALNKLFDENLKRKAVLEKLAKSILKEKVTGNNGNKSL